MNSTVRTSGGNMSGMSNMSKTGNPGNLRETSQMDNISSAVNIAEHDLDRDPDVEQGIDLGLRWNNSFASLGPDFHTELSPQPLPAPYWVGKSRAVARDIGLSEAWLESPALLDALSGNARLAGTQPLASVYSGHQFGQWAGQLGDGRAILLGEVQVQNRVQNQNPGSVLGQVIIENLQREDLSPLDEAMMYDRMIRDHGYSIRRLAQKLGKDKGYLENRLRLAGAPVEIQQLVSVRKDTISHAYELMKVEDPRKRRRLAEQVARGELTLVKLRERVEGRRRSSRVDVAADEDVPNVVAATPLTNPATYRVGSGGLDDHAMEAANAWTGVIRSAPAAPPVVLREDSLISAKQQLAEAIEGVVDVLRAPDVMGSIGQVDRANLAKYLTIAKLRLENAIAMVRSGEVD